MDKSETKFSNLVKDVLLVCGKAVWQESLL